ncbi:MAG: hypothetical protein ACI91J_001818, partial [Yoonia sp.]
MSSRANDNEVDLPAQPVVTLNGETVWQLYAE